MIKTQVQLPDQLYHQAKAIAAQREWSFAEVVRRGLEYMATAYPVQPVPAGWELPVLKRKAFAAEFDQLDFKALAEQEELCRLGE
jgi:hypothetical protein